MDVIAHDDRGAAVSSTHGRRRVVALAGLLAAIALLLVGPMAPTAHGAGQAEQGVVLAVEGEEATDEAGSGSATIVLGLLGAVVLMGVAFARISGQD